MSWSRLAVLTALAAGVALLLRARRRGEVWHRLADRDSRTGP